MAYYKSKKQKRYEEILRNRMVRHLSNRFSTDEISLIFKVLEETVKEIIYSVESEEDKEFFIEYQKKIYGWS